eukprot:gene4960-5201_t
MEFIAQELAVLALAYDGCCRLLSAVDGSIRTCWKSFTGSCFTAVACTGPGSEGSRISCGRGSASTRFAVVGPSSLDVWELRRDLQHGILPTGHKLTVFAVQACQLNVQPHQRIVWALHLRGSVVSWRRLASLTRQQQLQPQYGRIFSLHRHHSTHGLGKMQTILQWDVGCGRSILNSVNVAVVGSELSAMTFLQAWGILATGHDDGNVLLWRLDTGSHIALAPAGHSNTVSCLAPVATAKGDELLLSGGFDGATAAIREVSESPEVLVLLYDKEHEVVISGGNDGVVRVWSGTCNGELLGQHLGHAGPVNCLAVDANFLFSGSSDTTVRVWDMLPANFGSSNSATGNDRQPRLAGTSPVGSPAIEMHCGVDTHQVADKIDVEVLSSMTSGQGPQMSYAGGISHAGRPCSALSKVQRAGLVTSSFPGAARPKGSKGALSCPHSIPFRILQGHAASVMGLDVVASNGLLVSAGRDGRLIQWDYINGSMLAQQHVQGEQLLCLSVQHGSGIVFAGTHSGQVLSFQLTAQMPRSAGLDEDDDVLSLLEADCYYFVVFLDTPSSGCSKNGTLILHPKVAPFQQLESKVCTALQLGKASLFFYDTKEQLHPSTFQSQLTQHAVSTTSWRNSHVIPLIATDASSGTGLSQQALALSPVRAPPTVLRPLPVIKNAGIMRGPYDPPLYNAWHHLFTPSKVAKWGETVTIVLPNAPQDHVTLRDHVDDPTALPWITTCDPDIVAELLERQEDFPKTWNRAAERALTRLGGNGIFTSGTESLDWQTAHDAPAHPVLQLFRDVGKNSPAVAKPWQIVGLANYLNPFYDTAAGQDRIFQQLKGQLEELVGDLVERTRMLVTL